MAASPPFEHGVHVSDEAGGQDSSRDDGGGSSQHVQRMVNDRDVVRRYFQQRGYGEGDQGGRAAQPREFRRYRQEASPDGDGGYQQRHKDAEAAGRSQPDAEQNAHDGFHIHLRVSSV